MPLDQPRQSFGHPQGTVALKHRAVISEAATGRRASFVTHLPCSGVGDARRRSIGSNARTMRDRSMQRCPDGIPVRRCKPPGQRKSGMSILSDHP
jgi:hypothetical protein